MRGGVISVLARAGKEPGVFKVYAQADGLPIAVLPITLQ